MDSHNKSITLKIESLPSVLELSDENLLRNLMDVSTMNSVCKNLNDVLVLSKEGKAIGLSYFKKKLGDKPTKIFVKSIISRVCSFLNLNQNMNEEQIEFTSELVLEEFFYLTPQDVWLWHKEFISGKYVQLFGRLDGQIILESLRSFSEKRMELSEKISLDEHNKIKNDFGASKQIFGEEALKNFYKNSSNNLQNKNDSLNTVSKGQSLREKFGTENF